MQDTGGEIHVTFFCKPLHMDNPVLDNQQELIYISFVWRQNVVWKTCQGDSDGWREKEYEKCVQSV